MLIQWCNNGIPSIVIEKRDAVRVPLQRVLLHINGLDGVVFYLSGPNADQQGVHPFVYGNPDVMDNLCLLYDDGMCAIRGGKAVMAALQTVGNQTDRIGNQQ